MRKIVLLGLALLATVAGVATLGGRSLVAPAQATAFSCTWSMQSATDSPAVDQITVNDRPACTGGGADGYTVTVTAQCENVDAGGTACPISGGWKPVFWHNLHTGTSAHQALMPSESCGVPNTAYASNSAHKLFMQWTGLIQFYHLESNPCNGDTSNQDYEDDPFYNDSSGNTLTSGDFCGYNWKFVFTATDVDTAATSSDTITSLTSTC